VSRPLPIDPGNVGVAAQYASHRPLLTRPVVERRGAPDAIIVPATRPAQNIVAALKLGKQLGAHVIVMHSGTEEYHGLAVEARSVGLSEPAVVTLSEQFDAKLPCLGTLRYFGMGSGSDLHRKRNFALTLGRLIGWRTIFFLDDDIEKPKASHVRQAVGMLSSRTAVGLPPKQYPDNSIVCHAHRFTGGKQEVFIAGSALAVNVQRADSFFPDIYNEDWLFLAPHLDQRAVSQLGSVTQRAYFPFENPDRARLQEFGDLIGEGLLGYLHNSQLSPRPSVQYWKDFLSIRKAFTARIKATCTERIAHDPDARAALAAVDAADAARAGITPADLDDYVDIWIQDLQMWGQFVADLPRLGNMRAAMSHLGLADTAVTTTRGLDQLKHVVFAIPTNSGRR
jgi:hypothetical protein